MKTALLAQLNEAVEYCHWCNTEHGVFVDLERKYRAGEATVSPADMVRLCRSRQQDLLRSGNERLLQATVMLDAATTPKA